MLRVAGLSLLLGFAALLVVLTQFYPPPAGVAGKPPILGTASNVRLQGGSKGNVNQGKASGDGALQLRLRRRGAGTATLDTGDIKAIDYAFLHLALDNPPEDLAITIYMKVIGIPRHTLTDTLQLNPDGSLWLATHELDGWAGTIDSVTLNFEGRAGDTIRIRDFALYPATPLRQLQAIYSDLVGNAPWRRADMNTHTGVTKTSSFYPVPLAVSLLLFSVIAYGALILLSRNRLTFSWTVVGLIFLACWVALDLVWQNRLLYQVAHSHRVFAGKTTGQKLAAGPDRALYGFIAAAKKRIEPADARVFVATQDIYQGMRGAYYLYPFNTFWTLEPPEIPQDQYLRAGDYVLVIRPALTSVFNGRGEARLKGAQNRPHRAELIYNNRKGSLVRLK